jgi:adenosylcobyric acid synthase
LPGTKQTLDDLRCLEDRAFVRELRRLHDIGVPVIGVCGGFQMLGISIEDPKGIENQGTPISQTGLALLPVRTVLQAEKTVRRVRGRLRCDFFGRASASGNSFAGYEIHVGETFYETGARPLADLTTEENPDLLPDGAISDSGRVLGTYVHGFFDQDEFRHAFIEGARAIIDLAPATEWAYVAAQRQARIDRLASHLRKSFNMNLIKSWIVDSPMRAGRIAEAQPGIDGTYDD